MAAPDSLGNTLKLLQVQESDALARMAHSSKSSFTDAPPIRMKEGAKMDDPEDRLCNICCVEPSDVYFVPCCHQSCAQCVQKLRIANIYKVSATGQLWLGESSVLEEA